MWSSSFYFEEKSCFVNYRSCIDVSEKLLLFESMIFRDKNDLLDLCDRLLDMNPAMRPTTQMV